MGDICLAETTNSGGLVFYSDNTAQYYATRQDCLRASVIQIQGVDVLISRHDFTVISGVFGALLGAAIFAVLFRSIT